MRLLARGQTYLDSLQAGADVPRQRGALAAGLRRVFGSDHPLLWARPRWRAAPGSAAAAVGPCAWKRC